MKTQFFLTVTLFFLAVSVSAQENKASASLTAAIYEEEVSGNLNKAVTLYLDILKKYPSDRQVAAKTLYHLGLVSEKLGQQKADEYYRQLVTNYPDQTEMATLAKAKLVLFKNATSESTKKAEQSFKQAAELFKQLKYEQAVTEYEKVIKLAPESSLAQEARLWIGHCYFKQGKNEQALKSFNTILKDYPKSNLVPVAELMAGQVKLSITNEPQNRSIVVIDDKTILDTLTGVKYTKINSWAGKYDIINPEISITDIFANRKYLLSGNQIVPFDNTESITLFDTLSPIRSSRLSPDGTQVAFFSKNSISVVPVSTETGRPTGPPRKLLTKQYEYGFDLNWSPDGNNLIFSLAVEKQKISIWTLSINDGFLQQITSPYLFAIDNMIYSKNEANILYKQFDGIRGFILKMKSIEGKSLPILDSLAGGGKRFILSPDNSWIMYNKIKGQKMLYRMADKEQLALTTPEEVGDFVLWSQSEPKVFFYRPSAGNINVMKVATIFGGSVFEVGPQKAGINIGWSPYSNELVVVEGTKKGEQKLKKISLTNHSSTAFGEIANMGTYPSLSPDGSKILLGITGPGQPSNLSVVPVSLKDCKVTGKPIPIYKSFLGFLWDCAWSPDGTKIALCDRGDVWICDAEGGTPRQLTKSSIIENFPNWSPDGNSISVFIRATNQLQILNATSGEVLKTFENVEADDWTPDGKEITIAYLDGQLNAISLLSGKSRNIANWKVFNHWTDLIELAWSPDGKCLALNGFKEGPQYNTQLFLISAADGKSTEVAVDIAEDKEFIHWSPDSKWISYYSYDGSYKDRVESTLWEADLSGFMKKIKPGKEMGYTADMDLKTPIVPAEGIAPDGTFTDSRDGHVYTYNKIGDQTWMTENLAYLPEVSPDSAISLVKNCYYVYGYKGHNAIEAKNTENYRKYGVLYNWPAAMNGNASSNNVPSGVQGICPAGWHIPSDAEWMILEKHLGMSDADLKLTGIRMSGFVYAKLKTISGWDDDNIYLGQSGFNAIASGLNFRGRSTALNQTVYYWTSTSENGTKANYRNFYFGLGMVRQPNASREMGLSIRCIKD